MTATLAHRPLRAIGAALAAVAVLLACGASGGVARAAEAAPAGNSLSVGDPNALGQIDLYVDPLCPFSGRMVQTKGAEIGKRLDSGALRVNVRFVDFLDKRSASGTYDDRAIYAAYVVADQSRSSDTTWRFVERIYSKELQPKEKGSTDLSNDQLADAADAVGAPPQAVNLIRVGLPIGYDARAIAAANVDVLQQFPEPGVPLVVIDGQPVDGESDWLARLPG